MRATQLRHKILHRIRTRFPPTDCWDRAELQTQPATTHINYNRQLFGIEHGILSLTSNSTYWADTRNACIKTTNSTIDRLRQIVIKISTDEINTGIHAWNSDTISSEWKSVEYSRIMLEIKPSHCDTSPFWSIWTDAVRISGSHFRLYLLDRSPCSYDLPELVYFPGSTVSTIRFRNLLINLLRNFRSHWVSG